MSTTTQARDLQAGDIVWLRGQERTLTEAEYTPAGTVRVTWKGRDSSGRPRTWTRALRPADAYLVVNR